MTVPTCNREYDNHFIVLSHLNITPQEQSMISRPFTLFWQQINQFFRWTTPFMSSIWQGSFNYQFGSFGLTRSAIEPGTPRHRANVLTTRIPCWFSQSANLLRQFNMIENKIMLKHTYNTDDDVINNKCCAGGVILPVTCIL